MKLTRKLPAVILLGAILLLTASPVFAQLGDITPPPAPAVDLCPNIDGAQASIPTGMILDGSGNCVTPPPTDTTAPVISAVVAASVSSVAESITWITDELSVSTFEYGTTQSYGSHASISASAAVGGTAALTGLQPNTTYYYCIHATDASSNTSDSCSSFLTASAIDTIPPVVSAVAVVSFSTSTATISWASDEFASTQVEYSLTSSYGSATTLDTNPTLVHTASISGLTPNTTYHYRVKSVDGAGNVALGDDNTFTTAALGVVLSDTTPPVISGIAEGSIAATAATIVWETNELATSSLEYGLTSSYGFHATLSASALLVHEATILNLQPNTTYYYCIHATDLFHNVASSCGHTFTTASAPLGADTNPPTISLVTVASVATSTATISWTTNEVANAGVEYGLTADYGASSSLDENLALTRSKTLIGLAPNTLYHYRVRSSDEVGNIAVSSDEIFTTAAISGSGSVGGTSSSTAILSSIETVSVATSTTTITWTTDLPADSQIEYGVSELFGQTTTLNSTLTTSHSVTLSGLAPNTNYIFRVKSKAAGAALPTVSANYEFNTLSISQPTTQAANVSSVAATSTTSYGTSVGWNTDIAATGQVEYGITSAYGQTSAVNGTLSTLHSIPLTSLDSSTTYHYRVRAVTAAGDVTLSSDHTFTTSAATPGVAPAAPSAVASLAVAAHNNDSATLTWNAASANSDAAMEYDIRYSTFPITEQNFANATQAQSTPVLYVDLEPNGVSRTYLVAGLNQNTTYYFAVKAKHGNSDWSLVSNIVSATTTSAPVSTAGRSGGGTGGGGGGASNSATVSPILLNASGEDSAIVLTWKNPNEASFVRALVVVRKDGSYPTSPKDGQVLYEGRSETYTDMNVLNGKTYYYSIYSYDEAKHYSNPVHVALAPKSGVSEEILRKNPELVSTSPDYHFVKTFKRGDSDIEIEHLQQLLAADQSIVHQGFTTGYFGVKTEAALKRFQANHNLPQTGMTDEATQKLLNVLSNEQVKLEVPADETLFANDLRYGQQGDAVTALQEFLVREGSYPEGLISGYFGTYTRSAVRAFQKKYGVQPVSGYVGYKTRHVMRTITGL